MSQAASLSPADPGYPPRLAALGARAPRLHVRGVLRLGQGEVATSLSTAVVAIVGARAASAEKMALAEALAASLARAGAHVVSGGALGIDGAAHRGALAGGGATTVVLGCGVDVAYPARHAAMFAAIVASGGALVSALPPGAPPRPAQFLARNALIAAVADAVVVVEAAPRSGSLSTAERARALGRVVAAVPGSAGCDRLLRGGAAVVESAAELAAALAGAPRRALAPAALLDGPALEPGAAAVAGAVAAGITGVEALVARTGLSVRQVVRALALLELGGSAPRAAAPAGASVAAAPAAALP